MQVRLGFLCVLLSFTQLCNAEVPAQLSSDFLMCESDYWLSISCFLNSTAITNRMENVTFQLKFDINTIQNGNRFCSLSVEKDGYHCVFKANLAFHPTFADYHEVGISLCELKRCVPLKSKYKPAQHIKPITPYNVTVKYENGNYTFSWNTGYESHHYASALVFQYIFIYQHDGLPSTMKLHINTPVVTIAENHFDPGTEYIAKVYSKIIHNNVYAGTTSDGSIEIRWKTPKAKIRVAGGIITVVIYILVTIFLICLAVGLLFPVARMKINKRSSIETPAPYISPLNQTARDNFKFWLSQGHVQQLYSEEISVIDVITEITAREQLQTHNQDIYSKCHTPYVGPLMEVWASFLKPDPDLTANKPCDGPDFLPDDCGGEKTLFCLSTADAGEGFVSLDDLEPSPESCKNSEALIITANPVCFAQNYCTLTNTATGLIPTFCSVHCVPGQDLGLNGHTSPDLLNIQMEENTPELDTVTLDNMQLSIEEQPQ